jgi:hypothetical protein
MLPLLQTSIPLVILCMRAKYPMEKKGNDWVRSGVLEPKQSDDILYEMFVHGWIDQAHGFHLTKSTSKALMPVFAEGKMISLDTGRALAAWASGGTIAPTTTKPSGDGKQLSDLEFEDLKLDGRIAAKKSTDALRDWFVVLPKNHQAAVKPYMDATLKPMAAEADKGDAI